MERHRVAIIQRLILNGPRRHRGTLDITRPDADEVREDPAIASAFKRLAVHVFRIALEDLAAEDHVAQDAWMFLSASLDGTRPQDRDLQHWYAYIQEDLSAGDLRRTAERARSLARSGRSYQATTLWGRRTAYGYVERDDES